MLELVVSSDAEVLRYLRAPVFQRAGLAHSAADSCEEAERLIRDLRPHLALLATQLPGDVYALCRRIKDDPELAATSVILLERQALGERALAAVADSGCDDVLALPLHPDDFYHHLAQLAGLPQRRHHRVPVAIEVELSPDRKGDALPGKVINLSPRGAGVEIGAPVGRTLADLEVRFGGQKAPALRCRVAWCHPNPRGSFFAGLDFIAVPAEARSLLDQLALFEISRGDDFVTAALQGEFDESTDFGALGKVLAGAAQIDFNMQAVGPMTPDGARIWCQLLAGLDGRYAFRHCSVAFTRLAATSPEVLGDGEVVSAEAPYRCRRCERDELRLVEAALLLRAQGRTRPLPLRCRACGELLAFDGDPDAYFAFLGANR